MYQYNVLMLFIGQKCNLSLSAWCVFV